MKALELRTLVSLLLCCLIMSNIYAEPPLEEENSLLMKPKVFHDTKRVVMMPGLNLNTVINNSRPGSIIYFEPGKYYLDTIIITNQNDLTLRAESGRVSIKMINSEDPYLIIHSSTNIQISGLSFEYDNMLGGIIEDSLIQINRSEKIDLNYNEVSGNALRLFDLQNSKTIRINNNLLWGICLHPILFEQCRGVSFISNIIKTISDYPRFDGQIIDSNFPALSGDQIITIENVWSITPIGD